MNTHTDKINLNINSKTEITVNATIAPIQHTAGNFHEKMGCISKLANRRTRKSVFSFRFS